MQIDIQLDTTEDGLFGGGEAPADYNANVYFCAVYAAIKERWPQADVTISGGNHDKVETDDDPSVEIGTVNQIIHNVWQDWIDQFEE